MQYEDYKVEDFLFDEFFVRWIKNPGPETEHFWESWIEKNQEKIQTINEAREIINSIKYKNRYEPSEEEYNEALEHILKQHTSWTQLDSYKKNDGLTSMVRYAAAFLYSPVVQQSQQPPSLIFDAVHEIPQKHPRYELQ